MDLRSNKHGETRLKFQFSEEYGFIFNDGSLVYSTQTWAAVPLCLTHAASDSYFIKKLPGS